MENRKISRSYLSN